MELVHWWREWSATIKWRKLFSSECWNLVLNIVQSTRQHSTTQPSTQYHTAVNTAPHSRQHSTTQPSTQHHTAVNTVPHSRQHSTTQPSTQHHTAVNTVPHSCQIESLWGKRRGSVLSVETSMPPSVHNTAIIVLPNWNGNEPFTYVTTSLVYARLRQSHRQTDTQTRTHTDRHIHTHTHTQTHVHTSVRTHAHKHAHTSAFAHLHTHAYTYAHQTHTHTQTHKHLQLHDCRQILISSKIMSSVNTDRLFFILHFFLTYKTYLINLITVLSERFLSVRFLQERSLLHICIKWSE